jgi:plastocyanin
MPRTKLTPLLAAVAIAVTLLAAGCTSTPSPTAGGPGAPAPGSTQTAPGTIVEQNFAFAPSTLTVPVGTVVTFVNQDQVAHHVFVGTTDLGVQQPGASVTWNATANGTFAVKCVIHPSMTGQITVGAAGSTGGGTGSGTSPSTGTSPSAPSTGYGY